MKAKITWRHYVYAEGFLSSTGENSPYIGDLCLVRVSGFQRWGLRVTKTGGGDFNWDAEVEFVSQEAPHDVLKSGYQFSIWEGKKSVADGMIL